MISSITSQPNTFRFDDPKMQGPEVQVSATALGEPQMMEHEENKMSFLAIPFPWKLHEMLESAEKEGFEHIVSWLPDNRSFRVHTPKAFVSVVMTEYFKQTKYKSFQRQLNMWGFVRLVEGSSKGGYTHRSFVRGRPELCRMMRREKIKGVGPKRGPGTERTPLNTNEGSSHLVGILPPTPSGHLLNLTNNLVSTVVAQSPQELPENGDIVLFEGKQFFFVDESDRAPPAKKANRRNSMELVLPCNNSTRHLQFSLEETMPPDIFSADLEPNPIPMRRAPRRFSLEFGSSKQIGSIQQIGLGSTSRGFSLENCLLGNNFNCVVDRQQQLS